MRTTSPRIDVVVVRSRRGGAILLPVLIFCVLILSAQAPARGGRGSVLQSWVLSAAAPVAHAASSLSRAGSQALESLTELFDARSENERLKRELAQKEQELFRLRAEVRETARERRLATAGSALPRVLGSAPVLLVEGRAGLQSALIGAGGSSGVRAGSPLAVPEGLVGRIVTVGRTVSRAQLLLDASAAAGARIVRTGELGVVRGDGRRVLHLKNIPTSSGVRPGDLVESAGIDGIYPRGVAIGRVESVKRGNDLFLEIRVIPGASFSRLTQVLVLEPSPAAGESLGRSGSWRP